MSLPAAGDVIIYHTGRLHVSITNSRAYELKTAPEKGFAHHIGDGCFSWDFRERRKVIDDGFVAHELADVFIKAAEFFLRF